VGAVIGSLAMASQKKNAFSQTGYRRFLIRGHRAGAAFMPTLLLSGLVLVLAGVCSIFFTSLGNSLLQLESSPQMRGRVMSFWTIAFLGSTTIGGSLVGWFGEAVGPRYGLALGGVAALVAGLLGMINLRKNHSQRIHSIAQIRGVRFLHLYLFCKGIGLQDT